MTTSFSYRQLIGYGIQFCAITFLILCCQREPCKDLPTLSIPGGLDEAITADLNWLNSIHDHLQNRPNDTLNIDTITKLRSLDAQLEELPIDDQPPLHKARSSRLIAFDLQNQGLYDSSMVVLTESIKKLEVVAENTPICLYELAYHYSLLGLAGEVTRRTEVGISNTRRAVEIYEKAEFWADLGKEYSNLARLYSQVNLPDSTNKYLQLAETILASYGDCFITTDDRSLFANVKFTSSESLRFQARNQLYLGDTATAVSTAYKALEEAELAKEWTIRLALSPQRSYIYRIESMVGSLGKDFAFLEEFYSRAEVATDSLLLMVPPTSIAYLNYFLDRSYRRAKYRADCTDLDSIAYSKAVNIAATASVFDQVPEPYKQAYPGLLRKLSLFECECGLLKQDEALLLTSRKRALESLLEYEANVNRLDVSLAKERIGGNWQGLYSDAASVFSSSRSQLNLSAEADFSDDIFILSDRSKSLGLSLSLERQRNLLSASGFYRRSLKELYALNNNYYAAIKTPTPTDDQAANTALTKFFSTLRKSPSLQAQRFLQDLQYIERGTSQAVQENALDKGMAAIDLFYGRGEIIVSTITQEDKRQFVVPATQSLVYDMQQLSLLADWTKESFNSARNFYDVVLRPTIDWLNEQGDIDHLIFVRDKLLDGFLYDYLPLKDGYTSPYPMLLDSFSTSYGYSYSGLMAAKSVYGIREKPKKGWGIFTASGAFQKSGESVPFLEQLDSYAKETDHQLGSLSSLYGEVRASEFLHQASDYRYLTIVAHGFSDPHLAEQHYFQLLPYPEENGGRVNTFDLYGLNLSANLTFALNCSSADGLATNSEGAKSIARSFHYAGSSAVIAGENLLKDGYQAEIMGYFNDLWIEQGLSAAQALHQAKLAYKKKHPYSEPKEWANLVLYGVPNVTYRSEPLTKYGRTKSGKSS